SISTARFLESSHRKRKVSPARTSTRSWPRSAFAKLLNIVCATSARHYCSIRFGGNGWPGSNNSGEDRGRGRSRQVLHLRADFSLGTIWAMTATVVAPPGSSNRILSLDALRGFVMFTMIYVNDIAGAPDNIVPPWMKHFHGKSGMTFVDLVFPAFLFIVG